MERLRTVSTFGWLTEVGQGGEANPCLLLNSTKKEDPKQANHHQPPRSQGDVLVDSWCLSSSVSSQGILDWALGTHILMPADGLAAWTRWVYKYGEIIFTLKCNHFPLLQDPAVNFSALLQHYFLHLFKEEKIIQDPALTLTWVSPVCNLLVISIGESRPALRELERRE